MKLRTTAAVALSTLLLVGACGDGDDSTSDQTKDDQKKEQTEGNDGLSESDLEAALLQTDDLEDIADGFEEESVNEDSFTGDDIVDGADECRDFLDKDYGAEHLEKVRAQWSTSTDSEDLSIFSTVESYEEGDAEVELEAVRDIFAECTSFVLDMDGTEVTVSADIIELADLSDDYDLADEGVAVALDYTVDGQTVQRQGYTLQRVGDVLTISGASSSVSLGDHVMLPITEAAFDRLQAMLDDVA